MYQVRQPVGTNTEKILTTKPTEQSYLDTNINTGKDNETISISVYDNRRLQFLETKLSYLDSNIRWNPAYFNW